MLLPAAMRRYQPRMLPILLFGMSFATAGLHAATQSGGFGTIMGPAPAGLLPLTEALAVLACIASPMLVRINLRRAPLLAGVGVAFATLIALLASPATVKILLLWNFGLAGYFPAIVYAVAFGTLAFTALSCRSTDTPLALGLALLVLGGLGLHSSYQSGLVILGLVTLGTTDPATLRADCDGATSRVVLPTIRLGIAAASVPTVGRHRQRPQIGATCRAWRACWIRSS